MCSVSHSISGSFLANLPHFQSQVPLVVQCSTSLHIKFQVLLNNETLLLLMKMAEIHKINSVTCMEEFVLYKDSEFAASLFKTFHGI